MSPPDSLELDRLNTAKPMDRKKWHQPPPPEPLPTFAASARVLEERSTAANSNLGGVQGAEAAHRVQTPLNSDQNVRVSATRMSHHKPYNMTMAYTPRECYRTDLSRQQQSTKASVKLHAKTRQTNIAVQNTKSSTTKQMTLRKTALVNAHSASRARGDTEEERWEVVDREEMQDGEYELVDARDGAQEGLEEWVV